MRITVDPRFSRDSEPTSPKSRALRAAGESRLANGAPAAGQPQRMRRHPPWSLALSGAFGVTTIVFRRQYLEPGSDRPCAESPDSSTSVVRRAQRAWRQ